MQISRHKLTWCWWIYSNHGCQGFDWAVLIKKGSPCLSLQKWRFVACSLCSVRLGTACIEFVYKCFPAFLAALPVETENLSSVCTHLLCVNWAHLSQSSIKKWLIVQWFYLFMNLYRERLQGNWLHHYQRAETARVSDKRLRKICLHLLFLYAIIPPSLPVSSSLSVCLQALNHQTE